MTAPAPSRAFGFRHIGCTFDAALVRGVRGLLVGNEFDGGLRMSPVDPNPNPAMGAQELARRRAAVAELGREVRELVNAVVGTDVDTDHLERTAAEVRALAEVLRGEVRDRHMPASVDDLSAGVRMYSPVTGAGNPLAVPMSLEMGGGQAVGRCTLGLAYEGPPSYGHGGVSALLTDHVLGGAAAASGNPGMTTELTVRYRRPVPLGTPLVVRGTTVDSSGRWVRATGTIAAVDAPEHTLVEAEATFAVLSREQARRLFPG